MNVKDVLHVKPKPHKWNYMFTRILIPLLFLHQAAAAGSETSPPVIVKQPPADQLFQVAKRNEQNDKPFIIECEAEGNPEPRYRWTKNGKDFNWLAYDDRISQQPGRGTLVISFPRDHDVGQYQCFATNEFGTATSNSVILRKVELDSFSDTGEVTMITAEEGKPFKLTCNAPDGWPKPIIGWFLQTSEGAVMKINSSRITVDPEGNLWFSNVTRNDRSREFSYTCSAFSRVANEYKLGNLVYLAVSPTTTTSSSIQNKIQPTVQYLSVRSTLALRGEDLELWCIIGGTPLPEIVWTKRGSRLPYDRAQYDNYGKTLRIRNVDYSDEGSYECSASNGIGQPVSYSVVVYVHAAPYFTRAPEPVLAAEGGTVQIVCEAEGRPAPTIKWIHNGKPIEEAQPNPRRQLFPNRIILRNVLKTDRGNYGCNVTNPYGYIYRDVAINMLSRSQETVEGRQTETMAIEGKSALLTCPALGAPKSIVKWFRNQEELTGGRYRILANGDLEIHSVYLSDAGEYTCRAHTTLGDATGSGKLLVKNATKALVRPTSLEVKSGGQAILRCTVVSDSTLDLIIEWLNDGELIDFNTSPHRYSRLRDNNALLISDLTELDSGTYTCLAKTELDNATAEAIIIVQDVPNPPQLLGGECRANYSTLRWRSMGDNRSPIIHYIVQVSGSFKLGSWESEVTYKEVPATENSCMVSMVLGVNYTFRVISVNKIGRSQPSAQFLNCTTLQEAEYENLSNVKGNVPASVLNFQIQKLGKSSFYLTWEKPEQANNKAIGYRIKYAQVVRTTLMEVKERYPDVNDPEITQAKLTRLQPNTTYRIFVAPFNRDGLGEAVSAEARTYGEDSTVLAKPSFVWKYTDDSTCSTAAARITWRPYFRSGEAERPGSHFFVQYKEHGVGTWRSAEEVLYEDFDIIQGLKPETKYVFRVVSLDGPLSAQSDEQEVNKYSPGGPAVGKEEVITPTVVRGDPIGKIDPRSSGWRSRDKGMGK